MLLDPLGGRMKDRRTVAKPSSRLWHWPVVRSKPLSTSAPVIVSYRSSKVAPISGHFCMTADQLKRELAAEVLRTSGRLRFRATGTSMLPSVLPGDVLTIEPVAISEASLGDLLLYHRDGRFWVHRLVRKAPDLLCTRGDALEAQDPPVSPDEILGRVVCVSRGNRSFEPARSLPLFRRILCFMIRRSSLVRRVLSRFYAPRPQAVLA